MKRGLIVLAMVVGIAACRSEQAPTAATAQVATAVPAVTAVAAPSPTVAPPPTPPTPTVASQQPPVDPAIADAPRHAGLRYLASAPTGGIHFYVDEARGLHPILVDRGSGVEPAMNDTQDRYWLGSSPRFTIDSDQIVTFTHEASGSLWIEYVGRVDSAGLIRDVHIATGNQHHPAFIEDAAALEIDRTRPLVAKLIANDATVGGWWYSGNTLAEDPACGASTLYVDDADGYRRVLPEDVELDHVVAVHSSATGAREGVDAFAWGRTLILSTVCPARYEGVRLEMVSQIVHGGEGSPAPGQDWVSNPQRVEMPDGQSEVRRVIDFYSVPSEAFGRSPVHIATVEHLTGDVETIAISNWGDVVETVEAGYLAEFAAASAESFLKNPVGSERLIYPYANELPPSDIAMIENPGADPTLAVVGHRHVQILSASGDPIERSPADSFGENALLTAIVSFEDSFILAVGGEDAATPLLPDLLRWNSGANTWLPITTSITQATLFGAGTATTPPSPPFPGAAAIMDMQVYNNIIWATGWVTVNDTVRIALWKSLDASNWTLELVPELGSGTEYGLSLSVNDLGVMINVGNWTHYGAGIIARPHGAPWTVLAFPTTNDATRIAGPVASSGDQVWVLERFFDGADSFWWSDDFVEWTSAELPPLEDEIGDDGFPDGGFWALTPGDEGSAIGWYTDYDGAAPVKQTQAWQWHGDGDRFVTTEIPGFYVGSTEGYVVTQDLGHFVIMRSLQADE